MNDYNLDNFNIRFTKLTITIQFTKAGSLPAYKVSALRGGIGDMLLLGNCIADHNCKSCTFTSSCVVQNIYYHKPRISPAFATEKANMGYIYECFDYREKAIIGETMQFNMILIGDVIVNFAQILQAMYQFSQIGIGKDHVTFRIMSIYNHRNEAVLSNNNVTLNCLKPDYLADYIRPQLVKMPATTSVSVEFITPWSAKQQGQQLTAFDVEAFVDSVYRKIYMLNCLEGNPMDRSHPFRNVMSISDSSYNEVAIKRFSSTHNYKITMEGLCGNFVINNLPSEFLPYLIATELVHIGKHTSMGFGKFFITNPS